MEAVWEELNATDGLSATIYKMREDWFVLILKDTDADEVFARFHGPIDPLLVKGMQFVMGVK